MTSHRTPGNPACPACVDLRHRAVLHFLHENGVFAKSGMYSFEQIRVFNTKTQLELLKMHIQDLGNGLYSNLQK